MRTIMIFGLVQGQKVSPRRWRWGLGALANLLCAARLSAQEASGTPDPGFWAEHGDKFVVAAITAVVVLLVQKPVKAALEALGRWLGNRLTGLGIRFKKQYLKALADQHRWLKLIGVYTRSDLHPPRLREVYISLQLASAGAADGDRVSWSELFSKDDRKVAILGAPGAGKTTLLDYLVLVFTGRVAHPVRERLGSPFPLFARLRELGADSDRATLTGLLRAGAPLSRLPRDFPERWLRRGGCVVLLDGLDEVLDEGRHQKAVEEIERLAADYPENRFIVTCRVAGWNSQLPGFRTYAIQELQDEDIRRFAGAWYREVLRTRDVNLLGAAPDPVRLREAESAAYEEARRQAESLWEQLRSNTSLLLVARTPLILSLMLLLHHLQVAELPQGRAALYERCLQVLLEIWDAKEKRLALPQNIKPSDKMTVLRTIAYRFLEDDRLEAGRDELEGMVGSLLPRLSAQDLEAGEILRHIHERSGLLVEQALERYGFAHRALADYLAARHIVDHELDHRLLERLGEERWREVTLIAVGLAPPARAERLVQELLEQGEQKLPALEMAGLSLAEEVQLGEDLKAEVVHRLRQALGRVPEGEGGSFGRLTVALMAADLAEASRWMGDVLRGEDTHLRGRVLDLLPEVGEEHARPLMSMLGKLIADSGEPAVLRRRAARALAGVGVEPGAEIWRSLAEVRSSEDLGLRGAATWAWCRLGRSEELGFVEVPAGEFLMGSVEGEGDDDERPQHTLYLPTLYIGKYPVTVGEFRRYVEETGREAGDTDALRSPDDHPVTEVSWHEALACAAWYGASLPSEAEWEKAARGTDGRRYPWGDDWRDEGANTGEHWRRRPGSVVSSVIRRLSRGRFPKGKEGGTTPVGAFSPAGDSPYGCTDMAGNVWEWTRSLWGEDPREPAFGYPYEPGDGREDLDAPDTATRVLRGGGFVIEARYARCSARHRNLPYLRYWYLGFRLLLSPFSSDL